MRIGILGGTFDPPHIGHLVIGDQARAQLGLDRVWFTPVGQPPHKSNTSPAADRVAMTRLAIDDYEAFEVCLVDVERPPPHYTVHLFEELRRRWPEHEFWFIIGADALIDMPRWQQPRWRPGRTESMSRTGSRSPGSGRLPVRGRVQR